MTDFEVYFKYGSSTIQSKVYRVDKDHNQFLVVDDQGYFHWVDIYDCRVVWETKKGEISCEEIFKKNIQTSQP